MGSDIEIVEGLEAHKVSWTTVPVEDLRRNKSESVVHHCPSIEIELCTPLLKDNISIAIPPDCDVPQLCELLNKQSNDILPIVIYCISETVLSESVSTSSCKHSYFTFTYLQY